VFVFTIVTPDTPTKITSSTEFAENKTYGLNIRNDFDYSIFKFQLNVDYESRA